MDITVPQPAKPNPVAFSTEIAFNALVNEAIKLGLRINKPMGLLYLPTQELTRNFQDACKAILVALQEKS